MPRLAHLAAAALAWLALSAPPARAERRVVRAVIDADLRFLDPIYSPAYITRSVAYLIYDMLFALDGEGRYQPQMVERYEVGADGLLWTFTPREGLVFSDGQPVKTVAVVGLGQFPIPALYRSNLRGVLSTGLPLFWSLRKS